MDNEKQTQRVKMIYAFHAFLSGIPRNEPQSEEEKSKDLNSWMFF